MAIQECKCPRCNRVENNYIDYSVGEEYCDYNAYYEGYYIKCPCGCNYTYVRWFTLTDTYIEELYTS